VDVAAHSLARLFNIGISPVSRYKFIDSRLPHAHRIPNEHPM
jgi:hypothetical protein